MTPNEFRSTAQELARFPLSLYGKEWPEEIFCYHAPPSSRRIADSKRKNFPTPQSNSLLISPCQRRSGHRSLCTSPAQCPDRIAKRAGFTNAPAFNNPFRAIAKAESLRGGRKISRDLEYSKTGIDSRQPCPERRQRGCKARQVRNRCHFDPFGEHRADFGIDLP